MDKKLEPYALGIGQLCMEWAQLENSIGFLFMKVAKWEFTPAASPMLACLDTRPQITAIKFGVPIRCESKSLCTAISESLDFVDNELRVERNRLVHDMWVADQLADGAYRVTKKPKSPKDADIYRNSVFVGQIKRVPLLEIMDTIQDVVEEGSHLFLLSHFLDCPPDFGQVNPLPKPPERRLLRRQREMQSRMDTSDAKPLRQPRPSAASRRKLLKLKDAP